MDTSRRTRGGLAALTAVVALTALGLSACGSGSANGQSSAPGSTTVSLSPTPSGSLPTLTSPSPAGTPARIPADSYSTDGLKLTINFAAGVCDKYGLQADETQAGKVLVTIVITESAPPGRICPALVKFQSVSTDLASPLDQRRVVDTTDGHTVTLAGPASGRVSHGPAPSQ